ncbi:hypothetical protein [Krasilnikovia sp. M28-CT-15]|uniref:hypothetical protein n=1 Tax=Krasilnikovia sp. M28-CT-15 TaxID=3373540 RepID=UPI003875F215
MPVPWLVFWSVTELVIVVAAVWSWWSRRAMYVGRIAVAILFIAGGALFNTLHLMGGGDYAGFADASYLPFVTDTWRAVVAPHQHVFIPLLVAFEVAVGVLTLTGGRWTRLALVAAIGFHIGLMFFGWSYYPFSIAMIAAFALLLHAELRGEGAAATDTPRAEPIRHTTQRRLHRTGSVPRHG